MDGAGAYVLCCALGRNATSQALVAASEVIIYVATGRGPIGSMSGMVHVRKDAVIIPVGTTESQPQKTTLIEIMQSPM